MENSIKTEAVVNNIEQKPMFYESQAELTKITSTTSKSGHTKRTGPTMIENGIIRRKQRLFKNLTLVQKPEKEKFTLYLKKKFLNEFIERGCTPELLDTCINTYNVDENEVKEYFGTAAKEAQQYIHQECDSLSFNNINKWLKYMQTIGAAEECNYEAAIITNAIANNENLPEPETMGGIDLKAIYRYLSNSLMGLPLPALDPASAKFLSNEFKNLINEANTDNADIDVQNMKTRLETILSSSECPEPSSIDPLTLMDANEVIENLTEPKFSDKNQFKSEK